MSSSFPAGCNNGFSSWLFFVSSDEDLASPGEGLASSGESLSSSDEGSASGDRNLALLEDGEYVLNKKAVQGMGGKAALDQLNFGMMPIMPRAA